MRALFLEKLKTEILLQLLKIKLRNGDLVGAHAGQANPSLI